MSDFSKPDIKESVFYYCIFIESRWHSKFIEIIFGGLKTILICRSDDFVGYFSYQILSF